jgi:deoxyribose-phosphate aldolase
MPGGPISSMPFQLIGDPDVNALRFMLSVTDLTSLNADDTDEKIELLCKKAIHPVATDKTLRVAAICVLSRFVKPAKGLLDGTGIKVATVAGNFPSGDALITLKLNEVNAAVQAGADEVDLVINYKAFNRGEEEIVWQEIERAKEICGEVKLKAILETGAMSSPGLISRASEIALGAGADFVKTSTGKMQPAATLPAARRMLEAIRAHHERSGNTAGIKPSGGITTAGEAFAYVKLVIEILGPEWLNAERFRLGASRLVDDIASKLSQAA